MFIIYGRQIKGRIIPYNTFCAEYYNIVWAKKFEILTYLAELIRSSYLGPSIFIFNNATGGTCDPIFTWSWG